MNNEEKRAKDMGSSVNRGSGAVADDADFRYGNFLVEHKYRNKKTIWIDLAWWNKVRKQALNRHRNPCVILENDDCSVVYFTFGDLDLLKYRFDLQLIKSSRSKWLRNENYIDRCIKAKADDKMYIIEYQPEKIMILEIDDFKKIANKKEDI